MAVSRFDDWPSRLVAYIDACRDKPFAWGSHDCVQFARNGIIATTGFDPAWDFDRDYHSQRTATLVLHDYAGTLDDLAEKFAARLGWRETDAAHIERGSLVMVPTALGDAFGLAYGKRVFAAGSDGLTDMPVRHAQRAWRP